MSNSDDNPQQSSGDPKPKDLRPAKRGIVPYVSSQEHLDDEFSRLNWLVRAATRRWNFQLAQHKDPADWGMLRVDQAEVDAILRASWQPLGVIPEELDKDLANDWGEAQDMAYEIAKRLVATPEEVRARLWLDALRRKFALTYFERDILLVCLLSELDPRYRRLFTYLMDDASRTQPTVELMLAILPSHLYPSGKIPGGQTVLAPAGNLLRHHLLVIGGEARGDETLAMRSLRLDDRIHAYLLGDNRPDGRLAGFLSSTDGQPRWTLDDSPGEGQSPLIINDAEAEELARLFKRLEALPDRRAVVYLRGPYGSRRQARAAYLCDRLGRPMLTCDVSAALASGVKWPLLVDLVYREARLRGAAVDWRGCQALLAENQPPANWETLLDAVEAWEDLSLLGSETAWEPAGRFYDRLYTLVDCAMPDYPTRVRLWRYYLDVNQVQIDKSGGRDAAARELANDFVFTAGQMEDAFVSARGIARGAIPAGDGPADGEPDTRTPVTLEEIYEGSRLQSSRTLVTLARRIRPRPDLTLDDVILPPANRLQLREVLWRDQIRSRLFSDLEFGKKLRLGKGLVVLFTGTSGTGKTLAAEALAGERGIDLYQVDLSAIVSKWVGETEKNINRVFAEVEGANAILFFDEADALFGKRAEVKDAQDRWANMEVNYLLQRIEAYSGTVILASNLRQNIDDAFLRRIHMIVDFPFPDGEMRRRIIRRTFPKTVVPPSAEALDRIADEFRLTGGGIKNSVVDAAARAVRAGRFDKHGRPRVTEEDLVLSIAREYQKLGRALTPDEFVGPHFTLVVKELLNPTFDEDELARNGQKSENSP